MKSSFVITLSILLTCHHYLARAQQINIRKYSVEDGLVNNDVLNIYQDSRGFIWLCTRGGLSRYDGGGFTNYTTDNGLTNDMINDIQEIAPQEFIVAQNVRGPRLLKNGRIIDLSPHRDITLNRFYRVNQSRLVVAADLIGMVDWNGGQMNPVNPQYKESVMKMAMPNDSVWLLLREGYSIQWMTPRLQALSPVMTLKATTAFADSRQRTWVGTMHGLKLIDKSADPGSAISFMPLPLAFDLPLLREAYISDFIEDSQANYWIGTNKGLVKISPDGKHRIFTDQEGLPASAINCLREDRQHNLWIGTPLGLAKLSLNDEIRTYTLKLQPSHDGTIFISPLTEHSLRLFDGKSISTLSLVTGELTRDLSADSNGYRIYKLNKEQLMVIHNRKQVIYSAGHPPQPGNEKEGWPDRIFDVIINAGQKHFIAAEGNKLFDVEKGQEKQLTTLAVVDPIYDLALNKKNTLWVGTRDSGLYKIRVDEKDHSLQLKTIDTLIGRLPDQHIRTLFTDREDELWIGTRYKGLVRLKELPDGRYDLQHFGTQEGLSSDFVRTVNRDANGNIWVGTMQGIDKLIPTGATYRIFNFGKVNRFFYHVYDIFFLNDYCLLASDYPYVVYLKDVHQDTLPPPVVYITGVFKEGHDTMDADNGARSHLPYDKAQVNFEFNAPQFINEDFTRFSYRLLGGGDTNWSEPGKSHTVYFANLRPGNYDFQVRALGFNGQWGAPAVYGFIVNHPFWQKAWFLLLVALLVFLLAYALYRYRIKQLILLQRVRNRIATDLHDEIGSNLTNISILSSLSRNSLSQPSKAGVFLQRISEEVSSSSQALDDIIWSVNSSHDTLEETVSRMRRYAAELFDAADISYELQLDPAFEERRLSMEQRRDIYLLFKEAVSNISKHAQAKKVAIEISILHSQLHMNIKDDGRGFDFRRPTARHGLKGMQDRVQKWKGSFIVDSSEGRGTFIRIAMPVSK